MARYFFKRARTVYKLQALDKVYFCLWVSPLASTTLESSYKSVVSPSEYSTKSQKESAPCLCCYFDKVPAFWNVN